MLKLKSIIAAACVAAAALLPTTGAAQIYKGETAGAGGPVHAMFVAFVTQAGKAGVDIQVNAGQTLTKSMLKGAKSEIDFLVTPKHPPRLSVIVSFMVSRICHFARVFFLSW